MSPPPVLPSSPTGASGVRRATAALLALAAAGASAVRAQEADPPAVVEPVAVVEWPDDTEAGDALAALPPPSGPVTVEPVAWPSHADPQAWGAGDPTGASGAWSRWAASLVESAVDDPGPEDAGPGDAGPADPGADLHRAATAALAQGRYRSAWRHVATLAAVAPDRARALRPCFLPGVTEPVELLPDGRLAALPPGAHLAPALPPPTRVPGRFDIRSATVRDLRIGGGTLDLTIGVRGDGIELELVHTAGEAVELSLSVPIATGSRMVSLYADWEAQQDLEAPVPIRLEPGSEPFRVWARTRGTTLAWPGLPVTGLDARLSLAGLQLLVDRDDPWYAELCDLSRALQLLIGAPVTTAARPRSADGSALWPVRVDVPPLADREPWLRELVDAAERFALGR